MAEGTFSSSFFWGKSSLSSVLEVVSTKSPSASAVWSTLIARKEMVVAFCGVVPLIYGCLRVFRGKKSDEEKRITDGHSVHGCSSTIGV